MTGVEFEVHTYSVHDGLTGAEGRFMQNRQSRRGIIALRLGPGDHSAEDTIDYLLKKAERGVDETPELLAMLGKEQL